MHKNFIAVIIFILVIVSVGQCTAQVNWTDTVPSHPINYKPLKIGERFPAIPWVGLVNFEKENPGLADYKGKLVILDFWSTSCLGCIEAFPAMEKLQQEFNGKLQVLTINPWETTNEIDERFKKIKMKIGDQHHLSLPGINGDSTWRVLFPILTIPHHVWINGAGVIIAITHGYNATSEHVNATLSGKTVDFDLKDDVTATVVAAKGYIHPVLPSLPPIYYSAFIPYVYSVASSRRVVDSVHGVYRVTEYNNSVIDLLQMAYRNTTPGAKERVLIELKNKEQYKYPNDGNLNDRWKRKYLFTYELQGPISQQDQWQTVMQRDVENFIGDLFAIQGKKEVRKLKTTVLMRSGAALPVSSGGKYSSLFEGDTLVMRNLPFKYVLSQLVQYLEDLPAGMAFVDETGIDENQPFDISLSGNLSDVNNIKRQFLQFGLEVIVEERDIEMLVIKERDR